MDIYLAIDLKNGRVVGGKAGRRDEYKEVHEESILLERSDPAYVIKTLKPKNVYVADLDRIEGKGDNTRHILEIAEIAEKTIADVGIREIDDVKKAFFTPVIGTETFDISKLEDGDYLISVDIRERLLDRSGRFRDYVEVLEYLNSFRISGVIVLPIHQVGTLNFNFQVVEKAIEVSDHEILTGGGLRSYEDLLRVKSLGVAGVIVSTAFHKGMIDPSILRQGKI